MVEETRPDKGGHREDLWSTRAERLLTAAIEDVRDNLDAIPKVSAALTALQIEAGEVLPTEMDGYPFPGETQSGFPCTCPPDLSARGGYRGSCPVHSPEVPSDV